MPANGQLTWRLKPNQPSRNKIYPTLNNPSLNYGNPITRIVRTFGKRLLLSVSLTKYTLEVVGDLRRADFQLALQRFRFLYSALTNRVKERLSVEKLFRPKMVTSYPNTSRCCRRVWVRLAVSEGMLLGALKVLYASPWTKYRSDRS